MSAPAFRKTVITRLFDASTQPTFVLDERRRIVYANQSLADWLQVDRDSLAGVTCDYVADSSSPVSGLCPPPSAFDGYAVEGFIHSPAKSSEPVAVIFSPIAGDDGATLGVVVMPQTSASGSDQAHRLNESGENGEIERQLHDILIRSRRRDADSAGVFPLVGTSPSIRRVRRQFNIAVESAASVLVCAAGGVAERVARAIHARRQPDAVAGLVPLTCPLLDAELVRTTLTAFMQRCAELETEQPPTLLLLDVEQLSVDAQRELSGFLAIEELALQTLATSAKSFDELQADFGFRDDLAAALSTMEIILPRLKNRPTDVPLVVQAALESHNSQSKHQLEGFETTALEQLVAYPWPGDLIEVEGIVAKAAKIANEAGATHVTTECLPREIRLGLDAVALPEPEVPGLNLDELLLDIERELVGNTLAEVRQNRAEAARRLGISRNKLLRRIAQLGLDGDEGNGAVADADSKEGAS